MILRPLNRVACALVGWGLAMGLSVGQAASFPDYPISAQQKATAQKVAEAGVPLSELAPNAPDSYTIKKGDTLWEISGLFLKSPWRWPELWGMNLQDIRNPHLIYPGQVLYLDKRDGRARLRVGEPVDQLGPDGKMRPRIREGKLDDAISTVNVRILEPFFNEAVIIDKAAELNAAPRIVATQEGRLYLARGETAYVRGDLGDRREFRLFRKPKALKDPSTGEILGYEGQYVGTAGLVRAGSEPEEGSEAKPVPSIFTMISLRQEAGVGDRLSPVPPRELASLVPHAPASPLAGQIASIYGDGLTAGQNQIVVLNKGARDGVEAGHVLALWRDGVQARDTTQPGAPEIKLPDERHGLIFVFRTFDKMSYALILTVKQPVSKGDRFSQP